MTKFEEKKKEAYEKASMKYFGNADGSRAMRYLLNELENAGLLKEQQALPVVPEDVDKAIKYLKTQNNFATLSDLGDILTEKGFWWLNDFQFKDRRFGFGGLNNKLFILSHLAITGYTVEKPQLFYLRDELTGQFLAKDNQFKDKDRYFFWTGADPLTHSIGTAWKLTFTQQEIDSMETGSYEQIPVPVEDNK
ncbi:DUF1642 domain-containing protein [Lactococcus lactis]|uniref:DUF1642 domain-containing protein n=1 Tax=Lactococcus lactis TaxID=1358 RepID=UPI0028902357|nr:DUF1642 domain-containing protein [Lactococcus lactis]MDT2857968.1 DUF1642 domain-containing protein [Lactococcus lactis]